MIGTPSSSSIISQDARRSAAMMHDMNELFDTMLSGRRRGRGRLGLDGMLFYDPFPFQRMMGSRQWPPSSYFLQEELPPSKWNTLVVPDTSSIALSSTHTTQHDTALGNTVDITQDDETLSIVLQFPLGTTERDISIKLNEENHVLSITGEMRRERMLKGDGGGISVHSRLERSFTLHPHNEIDMSKITARMDGYGVLTIVAPKKHSKIGYVAEKDNVRRIGNVEQQKQHQSDAIEVDETVVDNKVVDPQHQENIVTAEMNVDDDSVIDLD